MQEETKLWLKQAEENFKAAKTMFDGHRYSFTCFMCQQTLEVIFKATIIEFTKSRHPRIHDLGRLYEMTTLPSERIDRQFLEKTTQHFFLVRYPDMVRAKYDRELAEKTFLKTKEILKWIEKEIIERSSK
ncbi:hypothetical protein COS81_01590 [candidate division WWE3 bacterium CG06_land_8_20_14_3_00_42_16]|uniref:HEPN domain-containing protein n=4 Tax=Katanobacteria TaxID=422282 RepID=A0A2M7ANQ9_UNCKA|nr:MAG: hypothetical protein COS81_01590 [candidate division WWE3 bacterium CG06_land_8_20_14_3_00_42_16]PIZ42608.1 MAG: hypothetical protein COY34_02620 [candidate division WWE3 bacterium CG_4_10_14_0_2_um_filter_42_8]PJA37666.1 MAG: hypothetical protein CO181_02560 [candidate division WWE3 bacterium CG_4_9_14_3_um_filter_43_9]PJC68829.1 MAG: hypothetical protein CO015_02585 [candidate division WWE3 bacterium CG_4_8_14_3_um_filter_42_11]